MAKAEDLLKQILGVNDQEINTLLTLGLLYERTNRPNEAFEQYKKILEILPEDNQSREGVQQLIDNLNANVSNIQAGGSTDNVESEVGGEITSGEGNSEKAEDDLSEDNKENNIDDNQNESDNQDDNADNITDEADNNTN
jgi:tetratricopeptide (TPR) repeat protein